MIFDGIIFKMQQFVVLAADLGPVGPADTPPMAPQGDGAVAEAVNGIVGTVPAAEPGGWPWWIWPVYIGIFVAMYFFLIRPQRRREKKMRELQSTIQAGDNVITTGGLFGRVTDVGEDCFIIEFGINRSMRIPVQKSDVLGVRSPKMTPPPREALPDKSKDVKEVKEVKEVKDVKEVK